jgi:hypothetical protein
MRGEERAREQGAGSIEAGPVWPQADGCLTRSIVLNGTASDEPNASANPAITTQIPLRSHMIFHKHCGREQMLSRVLLLNQRKYETGIRDGVTQRRIIVQQCDHELRWRPHEFCSRRPSCGRRSERAHEPFSS